MNFRVQRLQTTVHHLRKTGVIGNVGNWNLVRFEITLRAAGAEELNARRDEPFREVGEAHFVADADQRALNLRIHF